jgi:hypothetical protein
MGKICAVSERHAVAGSERRDVEPERSHLLVGHRVEHVSDEATGSIGSAQRRDAGHCGLRGIRDGNFHELRVALQIRKQHERPAVAQVHLQWYARNGQLGEQLELRQVDDGQAAIGVEEVQQVAGDAVEIRLLDCADDLLARNIRRPAEVRGPFRRKGDAAARSEISRKATHVGRAKSRLDRRAGVIVVVATPATAGDQQPECTRDQKLAHRQPTFPAPALEVESAGVPGM